MSSLRKSFKSQNKSQKSGADQQSQGRGSPSRKSNQSPQRQKSNYNEQSPRGSIEGSPGPQQNQFGDAENKFYSVPTGADGLQNLADESMNLGRMGDNRSPEMSRNLEGSLAEGTMLANRSIGIEEEALAPIQIRKELFDNLVKFACLESRDATYPEGEEQEGGKPEINSESTRKYLNGTIFGRYLIIIRRIMKRTQNQILNIETAKIRSLDDSHWEVCGLQNWQTIADEVEKIGISIEEEDVKLLAGGNEEKIDLIFRRIERYIGIISNPGFLKEFDNVIQEDVSETQSQGPLDAHATELTLDEMITQRAQAMGGAGAKQKSPRQQSSMQGGGGSPSPAAHQHVQEESNSEAWINGSDANFQKLSGGFQGRATNQYTFDIKARSQRPQLKTNKVKDGVDILNMDTEKSLTECNSSLQLILLTLSTAFSMKPKQAAALLTNNNQYLVTACVKGVKGGRYDPQILWYELLIDNSLILAKLLEKELEQLKVAGPLTFVKVLAALGCGFYSQEPRLAVITFELFKELFEIFQESTVTQEHSLRWFLSAEGALSLTGSQNASLLIEPSATAAKQLGGLRLTIYALKLHPESALKAVELYNQLCPVDEQMLLIYKEEIQTQVRSSLEYLEVVAELIPSLCEISPERAINAGLIDFWLDLCAREAENERNGDAKEKIIALAVLGEIWSIFSDYIDKFEELQRTMIFVFKRAVRERNKSLRMTAVAILFRLLQQFSDSRNQVAPTIFKTLIFSLIENPHDPTIREIYLANFKELFIEQRNIPISLLLDPLVRQFEQALVGQFQLKIFDFDFFLSMIAHPKFTEAQAAQTFSLFGRIAYRDSSYSLAAAEILIGLIRRFLSMDSNPYSDANSPTDKGLMHQAVQIFVNEALEALVDLEPLTREIAESRMRRKIRDNQMKIRNSGLGHSMSRDGRMSSMSYNKNQQQNINQQTGSPNQTPGSISKPPAKARDLNKQSNSTLPKKQPQYKDVCRMLLKKQITTVLLKIEMLQVDRINQDMLREPLFNRLKETKAVYGYFNKGMIELMKIFGDPEVLISTYKLEPDWDEAEAYHKFSGSNAMGGGIGMDSMRSPDGTFKGASFKSRGLIHQKSNSPLRASKSRDAIHNAYSNRKGGAGSGLGHRPESMSEEERGYALVPYEGPADNGSSAKRIASINRQKAIDHINRLRGERLQKDKDQKIQQERLRIASARRKRRLKLEIEKRKQELGIADNSGANSLALMSKESMDNIEIARRKRNELQLVDLEDMDQDEKYVTEEYIKKYSKLWGNIFNKYQAQGYSTRVVSIQPFDTELARKEPVINNVEILKMLRDHEMYPTYISKEEISQLVRRCNQKICPQVPTGQNTVNYDAFKYLIMQVAHNGFSRAPKNMSLDPLVAKLETMLTIFTQAMKNKNLSTILYEDPDIVGPVSEKDMKLLKQLNEKIKTEPDYPLPSGFTKIQEKVPVYNYGVSEARIQRDGEAGAVANMILDDVMNAAFGIRMADRTVSMKEQYKVKISAKRFQDEAKAQALVFIEKAEQQRAILRAKELKAKGIKVDPEAEAKEEKKEELKASESLIEIPKGGFMTLKKEQAKKEKLDAKKREKERVERAQKIKVDLMSLKEEKKAKLEAEAKQKKEEEAKKKADEKARREQVKKKLEELKRQKGK